MKLSPRFNKFVGLEVPVVEEKKSWTNKRTGETHEYTEARIEENSTVMTDLRQAVQESGLHLRVWLPGTMYTMDYRMDRVNVHVNKDNAGKWHLGEFRLG